ncbi:prepilin-type N-terminal cleavage/methylation domain-containing protein [Beggiatoa alba B18LD]|uniref:Prepilin-type N-terminal cleavage/methylation domain-containing protein n=1 Tax=Beggiatoa alba B18LD TaxID=395493 RepID=I3CF94_9GAMM|nr:pilin [Beggiatoa alba]EIJ42287.1 prepilin-type N-terminal cleavage/methylation domain-containing protein [Beggiatoa alba B18LD]
MKMQQGFSIIELMVVIAIIGVLASIAYPIYTDYTTRAKVSDAIQLMAGLKTPLVEYQLTWGIWPPLSSLPGTKNSGVYTSYVETGTIDDNLYYIQATMRTSAGPNLAGKQVRNVYNYERRLWDCTTDGIPAGQEINSVYLPSNCR